MLTSALSAWPGSHTLAPESAAFSAPRRSQTCSCCPCYEPPRVTASPDGSDTEETRENLTTVMLLSQQGFIFLTLNQSQLRMGERWEKPRYTKWKQGWNEKWLKSANKYKEIYDMMKLAIFLVSSIYNNKCNLCSKLTFNNKCNGSFQI